MLRSMPFYWYTTLCYLNSGFLPRRISSAADFFRGFRWPSVINCTSDVIGVICRIWGAVIQLAMPPWLCLKCLFTLPVSCVIFQKSGKESTPNFCTPSRDKKKCVKDERACNMVADLDFKVEPDICNQLLPLRITRFASQRAQPLESLAAYPIRRLTLVCCVGLPPKIRNQKKYKSIAAVSIIKLAPGPPNPWNK